MILSNSPRLLAIPIAPNLCQISLRHHTCFSFSKSSKNTRLSSYIFVHKYKFKSIEPLRSYFVINNLYNSKRTFTSNMTNKPRINVFQQDTNRSNNCIKTIHNNQTFSKLSQSPSSIAPAYTIAQSTDFRNMAGIQKLALEPTREHIENIRHVLKNMNAKNNDNQQITLEKDDDSGIATVCIRSAAKNGISGKMMCDFLDIIDELYSWHEGKGVIIYGHRGFFCSGKLEKKNLFSRMHFNCNLFIY